MSHLHGKSLDLITLRIRYFFAPDRNKKMSKTEFARRVGISTTTVYRWLYGESFESSYLENVAKVMSGVYGFRISAEDLLNRDYILDDGEG